MYHDTRRTEHMKPPPAEGELTAASPVHSLAILSDIHGNVRALRAAADDIAVRRPDAVVVLGDLLTYGCEPLATLEELQALAARVPLWLVRGNHDDFYFSAGQVPPLNQLPRFVQESIQWTLHALAENDPRERFVLDWHRQLTMGPILFTHANPFPYGDWSYLNTEPELLRAGARLWADGYRVGVFGHTHRRAAVIVGNHSVTPLPPSLPLPAPSPDGTVVILNPGSVGQPRGSLSSMMYMRRGSDGFLMEFVDLDYDVAGHVDALEAAGLTAETTARLVGFFEQGSHR